MVDFTDKRESSNLSWCNKGDAMKFADYMKTHPNLGEETEVYVSVLCCLDKPETRVFREIKPMKTVLHVCRHQQISDECWVDDAKGRPCSAEWYNGCRPHCIYVSDTIEEAVADYNMQIQEAIDLREQQIRNYLNVMEKVVDQLRARKV